MTNSGDTLLHYRLVEKIGQGGMGAVWRARDTTLDRDVAIKVLPAELAGDPSFLARFEREAKLLASISHPHLASVFGVHDANGTRFLAMEMVPGEDLSQRLERGPIPMRDVIQILRRIAEALQAAHEKGVVHRDLKPANVRITPDRRVKVLDFGLAKSLLAEEADDPVSDSNIALTATGVVLGTAPYMSPEQARGRPVDARSDVWSFGCVAYECLTRARPFQGESVPDLVVAILNEEPDWTRLPADTPPSLRRMLRRCLAKSRRDRYHHIADAGFALDDAEAELDAPPPESGAPVPPSRGRRAVPMLLTAALAVAAGALLFALRREDPVVPAERESVLAGAVLRRITNLPGEELNAVITADGKSFAYLGDASGRFEVYFGGIEEDAQLVVTKSKYFHGAKYRQMGVSHLGASRDGAYLWIGGNEDRKLALVSLPVLSSKPWLEESVIHADWSYDGKRIVYSFATNGDPLFISDPEGGKKRPLGLLDREGPGDHTGYHQHFPMWSVDDQWIFVVRGDVVSGLMDLWRARVDGAELEQLTTDQRDIGFPVPIDKRTILFIGCDATWDGPWLWEFDLETREAKRVDLGLHRFKSLHASRDRRRLVATVVDPEVNLHTVPLLADRAATEADVQDYEIGRERALCPRTSGDALYFLSSRSGRDSLWCRRDGALIELWRPRPEQWLDFAPAVSPDGSQIAIVVREGVTARVYLLNADGTRPRVLTDDVDVLGGASWSPDGESIAVGGSSGGTEALFRIEVATGKVHQIGQPMQSTTPVWSPDGSTIIYAGPQIGPWQELYALTPDGSTVKLPGKLRVSVLGERVRFLPSGKEFLVMEGSDPWYEINLYSLETGEKRRVVQFQSSASMRTFDLLPDGKTIVFDRQIDNSDIVLIERR